MRKATYSIITITLFVISCTNKGNKLRQAYLGCDTVNSVEYPQLRDAINELNKDDEKVLVIYAFQSDADPIKHGYIAMGDTFRNTFNARKFGKFYLVDTLNGLVKISVYSNSCNSYMLLPPSDYSTLYYEIDADELYTIYLSAFTENKCAMYEIKFNKQKCNFQVNIAEVWH
jgi:hypothetical protein